MQMFPNLYKNAFKCGLETLKKDGFSKGLYAGTIPALSANISGILYLELLTLINKSKLEHF